MKKLVKIVAVAAVMALLAVTLTGCQVSVTSTSSSENSTTRNGITKIERTVTENGNTTSEVIYQDANGNTLSAEEGEAAFNGTAAATEAPAEETAPAEEATEAPATEAPAAEETAAEEATEAPAAEEAAPTEETASKPAAGEQIVNATLNFTNLTGRTLSGLYIVENTADGWGDNLLAGGGELANETTRTWEGMITYTVGAVWKIAVEYAGTDGEATIFPNISFDNGKDPYTINMSAEPGDDGEGLVLAHY